MMRNIEKKQEKAIVHKNNKTIDVKISEAIEQLQEIQSELGDIEIKAMVHSNAFGGDKHNFMKPLYLV